MEAKLTGGAVKKNQLQQYAKYVGENGNITYIFKNRPSDSVIIQMEKWVNETGTKAALQVAYIFD